jgi:hypothetical protein
MSSSQAVSWAGMSILPRQDGPGSKRGMAMYTTVRLSRVSWKYSLSQQIVSVLKEQNKIYITSIMPY